MATTTVQSQYLSAVESTLSNVVLRHLAHHIHMNIETLKGKGEDELVAEFHRVLQLSGQPTRTQAPGFPGAPMGQGPPSFPPQGQQGFPGPGMQQGPPSFPPQGQQGFPGVPNMGQMAPALQGGAAFAPPPGMMNGFSAATSKRGGSKPDPRWFSLQEFASYKNQGARLCAYCPSRNEHKHKVCGLDKLSNPQAMDPLDLRCDQHKSSPGCIRTALGGVSATGVMPPQGHPGFNMPPQGFPGSQAPPNFGQGPQGFPNQAQQSNFPGSSQGPPQFGQAPQGFPNQQMPGQQAPTACAARNKSLPEKYVIGIRNPTTGSEDAVGWLFYQNPPDGLMVIGKFGGHVPDTFTFDQNWPSLVQPLDEKDQRYAAMMPTLKYVYKATLDGNPIPQSTQAPQQQMGGAQNFPGAGQQQMPPQGLPQFGQGPQQMPPQPQGLPTFPGAGQPQMPPQPNSMPQFGQGPPQQMPGQPQGLPNFPSQGGAPGFPPQQQMPPQPMPPQQQMPPQPMPPQQQMPPQGLPQFGQGPPSMPQQPNSMPQFGQGPPSMPQQPNSMPQFGQGPPSMPQQPNSMPQFGQGPPSMPPSIEVPQGLPPMPTVSVPSMPAAPEQPPQSVQPEVVAAPVQSEMPPQPSVPENNAAPMVTVNA